MPETVRIEGLYAGDVDRRLDPPSAIAKTAIDGRVAVGPLGLAGDRQADALHHGGADRALLHYAREHYARWRAEHPACRFEPPGFGENLSTLGLDEHQVAIGDCFRAGGLLLEVSQPRTPCWKLDRRFGMAGLARAVQDSARCGWFYRVLEPGSLAVGDDLQRVASPHPEWTVARVMRLVHAGPHDPEALEALCELPALADNWRDKARRRLTRGRPGDGRRRLSRPGSGGH